MACGYEDRDGEAWKTRLHTLVTAYRQYKDELKKTGNATPSKKPPFFDELDKILSDEPSTQPKVVINSTTFVTASSWGWKWKYWDHPEGQQQQQQQQW